MMPPCSARCPAPTWPADSTPGTPASSAGPAETRRRPASSSAPTWATATSQASDAASWTSIPSELADDVVYQIGALQALAAAEGATRPVREAARRPVQRDRVAHRPGARRRRRREVGGPQPAHPGPARLGSPAAGRGSGPAGSDRSLRGPRLQPGRNPRVPLPSRVPSFTIPPKWRSTSCGWPPNSPSGPSTGPS